MLHEHLDRLRPVCPACRVAGRDGRLLNLGPVIRADGDEILEGVLLCAERLCPREHPIIDGIAVVVPDLQSWAAHQVNAVLRRHDLSSFTESLLGDAAGPDSGFDRERSNLSSYGRTHWGDLDPTEPLPREATLSQLLCSALELLEAKPSGVWVDLGCSVGRGTLELAYLTGEVVVGVDLSFSMLRVAEQVRREGRAVFPLRRVGMVYDRCELRVLDVPSLCMSFWCCDINVLPFADNAFDGAISLNVLDCVPSPFGHLTEMARVLRHGAAALVSTPYDWNPNATPVSQWLGGHSQRGPAHGSSAAEVRRVLANADTGLKFKIRSERDQVTWRVNLNERASMDYSVHLLRLDRDA